MNDLEEYCKVHLKKEVSEIAGSKRSEFNNNLSKYEKAIIYKYSEDGYESLNSELRKSEGNNLSEFGVFLTESLLKLPNYVNLVYRCVFLNSRELDVYVQALNSGNVIVEHTFVSTSKSRSIAEQFGGNTIFMIFSKSGKSIEEMAKYGRFNPPNEREVLFTFNTGFKVLEVLTDSSKSIIKMEEI